MDPADAEEQLHYARWLAANGDRKGAEAVYGRVKAWAKGIGDVYRGREASWPGKRSQRE